MKKYLNSSILFALGAVMSCAVIFSCEEIDDYKKYTESGEIVYPGKFDSVHVYAGRERVNIFGLFLSDPTVTELRIYWNGNDDSLSIPVSRTKIIDTLDMILEVTQGQKNFIFYTYDNEGNRSIPVYETGNAYGDDYQAQLYNRPYSAVINYVDSISAGAIIWGGMDLSTGAYASQVIYTDMNKVSQSVMVDLDQDTTFLSGYDNNGFRYRTLFLPEEDAIDIFYTSYQTVQ